MCWECLALQSQFDSWTRARKIAGARIIVDNDHLRVDWVVVGVGSKVGRESSNGDLSTPELVSRPAADLSSTLLGESSSSITDRGDIPSQNQDGRRKKMCSRDVWWIVRIPCANVRARISSEEI